MGVQDPRVRIAPQYVDSDGLDASEILHAGGLVLDPWQCEILDDWMGRTPSGRWSAPTCGGSVPRQNGKSLLVQARAAAGMLLLNEQVIFTAHLQKTATETFNELRDFFEHPAIRKYVDEIKTALGREQINLKNGAKIKFLARTRNGGRGQHGDLLIIDEAQELDDNQQASFLPAISASINPQTIYVGTPPDDTAYGDVFRKIRDRAIAGETKNVAWFEFSVEEIGDITDRERWASTNPALGRRVMMTTIESEYEQLDIPTFARERLGWWKPVTQTKLDYAIDRDKWAECSSKEPKPNGKTAYGIKFSADGAEVALCGAVIPQDGGAARISLIEYRQTGEGIQWLVDWLNERYKKASCVVIDGRNNVDLLVDRISDVWKAKGSVVRPGVRDVVAAASLLINSINEKSVSWFEQQESLNDSAVNTVKRNVGGGWGFGGDTSAPIEACALALWGAKTAKRDPNRKMRIV